MKYRFKGQRFSAKTATGQTLVLVPRTVFYLYGPFSGGQYTISTTQNGVGGAQITARRAKQLVEASAKMRVPTLLRYKDDLQPDCLRAVSRITGKLGPDITRIGTDGNFGARTGLKVGPNTVNISYGFRNDFAYARLEMRGFDYPDPKKMVRQALGKQVLQTFVSLLKRTTTKVGISFDEPEQHFAKMAIKSFEGYVLYWTAAAH